MIVKDAAQLAQAIDHTFLKADGTPEAIERLCLEAREFEFVSVMVNPAEIARCVSLLQNSKVRVGTVIGFPLGQNTTQTKLHEAKECIALGAAELDLVINQRALQRGDIGYLKDELVGFAQICSTSGVVSKVILECCNLSVDEKILGCKLVSEAGCTFVKTSTGFASAGATVQDVELLAAHVSAGVSVKAAGGIRSLDDALRMLQAGASRLGTSSGVAIMRDFVSGSRSSLQGAEKY